MNARAPSVGLPGSHAELIFWFDRLSLFERRLYASGWVVCRWPDTTVEGLTLRFAPQKTAPLASFGLPSPDLAAHYGPLFEHNRFDESIELDAEAAALFDPVLEVRLSDGMVVEIPNLSLQCASADPVHQLTLTFLEMLRLRPAGRMLEIGSRQRVGASLRPQISEQWSFVGLDICAGPSVDVVGDAHELSTIFPEEHFDAVLSLAVFEHLLMPWKVAIELNHVMKVGGLGFIVVPQAWPAHEEPWDYWRYSAHSWSALFNSATGFEIVHARQGEKASLVAHRMHAAVNFDSASVCYLVSAVVFRKIAPTSLKWPVALKDVVRTEYPL